MKREERGGGEGELDRGAGGGRGRWEGRRLWSAEELDAIVVLAQLRESFF